ncbi:MAG: histidine phosphatase family protein, partial [Saprospiraceae bacterium]
INEGQKFSDIVTGRFRNMIAEWEKGNLDAAIENGESGNQLKTRLEDFIQYLCQTEEKLILINSHGRSMKMMLTLMTKAPFSEMDNFHHHNTGLYILNCEDGNFTIETANDITHLEVE